jgi:streptomycin 6-kinase
VDGGRVLSPRLRLEVNEVVREKALAAGARAWLDDLPRLVATIEDAWQITVGSPYRDSSEAFVAEAICEDRTPAVLKLIVPRDGHAAANEITVLRLADGDGCAKLLRDDFEHGALLVERLGRSLHELGLPMRERHEILVRAARRVWRPATHSGLPTGAEKARWLSEFIARTWEELGRPCREEAVDHALACASRREEAHREQKALLVHGDVHQWNALEGPAEFKLVDPDGLLAEPEYDLGIIMREDPLEGDLHERCRWLASRTGLDPTAIWEWGVTERVSTGLLCVRVGLEPVGSEMLAAAERVASQP